MNDSYRNLANAIVFKAAKDYRHALEMLKKHPGNEDALYTKHEVERFLRSEWYTLLTSVDPEMLIKRLNKEVIG